MSIIVGDCRIVMAAMEPESVQCCVTSPPYFGLRDYGHEDQIGAEATVDAYVSALVDVFRQARRVLADDGTLWLNLGDSYAANRGRQVPDGKHIDVGNNKWMRVPGGLKSKDLIGIPWRVAFALQADGWYLRKDIIWAKPNPMPESVRDRPTSSHEHVFLFAKSEQYHYDAAAIAEPTVRGYGGSTFVDGKTGSNGLGRVSHRPRFGGIKAAGYGDHRKSGNEYVDRTEMRNKRDVWTIPTRGFSGAHFAVMPEALVAPCIQAGSRPGDTVLDPFGGAGTVALVAERLGRRWKIIELNSAYAEIARRRIDHWRGPLLGLIGQAVAE